MRPEDMPAGTRPRLTVVKDTPPCDHEYDCYQNHDTQEPVKIVCKRCGRSWKVVEPDE